MSHSWEHKKLGTSYSETTHLFGLKLWLQGVLMRAPCCRSFKSNRCLVSEYEAPNFLGSQEWDIFLGTPCTIYSNNIVPMASRSTAYPSSSSSILLLAIQVVTMLDDGPMAGGWCRYTSRYLVTRDVRAILEYFYYITLAK